MSFTLNVKVINSYKSLSSAVHQFLSNDFLIFVTPATDQQQCHSVDIERAG
jgi:hypothetical protein